VNWFTEIANEDPVLQQSDLATWRSEKNKDLFHDRSPIFFVDQIKAPCFWWPEAMIRDAPRKKPCRWVMRSKSAAAWPDTKLYETKGHGFARVENQIDAYKRVSEFLKAESPQQTAGVLTLSER